MTTKIKTVNSTSNVTFTNISGSYYDMIISIQHSSISQTINILDTEGNDINDQPITLTRSVKIIVKDQKIGSISFADINVYDIIISYSVKRESTGIPYIDFDYSTSNTYPQAVSIPGEFSGNFTGAFTLISPVPTNKMWKITQIAFQFIASTTGTYNFEIQVSPNIPIGSTIYNEAFTLAHVEVSTTSGSTYTGLFSVYAQNQAIFQHVDGTYSVVLNIPIPIDLFNNYSLYISSGEKTNVTDYIFSYTEEATI